MRVARLLSLVIIAQLAWAVGASGQTPAVSAERSLTLIPTAIEELNELRINTGEKAVLKDGTMSAVYTNKKPLEGNIFLNFHVDVATQGGPVVLHGKEIRLESSVVKSTTPSGEVTRGKTGSETPALAAYTPFDWFIDTGSDEVRGEALTVNEKAIVQFTIEVPVEGRDELTLFMHAKRVGTVREIRQQIARDGGIE